MSSFFGKLKGSGAYNPLTSTSPSKKETCVSVQTPLEKLLGGASSLREDGGDKFFGMENFGNTCYCNSILQALYHSPPFREQVVGSSLQPANESVPSTPNGLPRLHLHTPAIPNGALSMLSPPSKGFGTSTTNSPARKAINTGASVGANGTRVEDKPDSAEYKKKLAIAAGPVINLDYDHAEKYGISESLFTSLKGVFDAIAKHPSRMGVVSPQQFLETLKRDNEVFRTPMHQDAHEFLNLLLNEVMAGVEANAKRQLPNGRALEPGFAAPSIEGALIADRLSSPLSTPSSRWVHELFEGTLTSETKCLTCEKTSSRDEAFLDLSVDLEHQSSVTACLRKFSEEEMLCERNKFHCDNCGGLQEAEKRMKVKRSPRILALHLKRFKYSEDMQRMQKLHHRVVYAHHLRLVNMTDDAEDPDRLYELYAVVVHIGPGAYQGHYVSVIKTPDRGWLLFDDELVEPVDKSFVYNFFGNEPHLACAYVLFYQQTTVEAVRREQEAETGFKADASVNTPLNVNVKSTMTAQASPAGSGLSPLPRSPHPTSPEHLSLPASATTPTMDPPSPGTSKKNPFKNFGVSNGGVSPGRSEPESTNGTQTVNGNGNGNANANANGNGNGNGNGNTSGGGIPTRAALGYRSIRRKMKSSFSLNKENKDSNS
ncbi:MAG: hypothetical protein M1823_004567 [Watsoniomyces obsoletus]|nr:MAG: hypothetical protein M1823_004567 [Watsoniomyces obsoletus]